MKKEKKTMFLVYLFVIPAGLFLGAGFGYFRSQEAFLGLSLLTYILLSIVFLGLSIFLAVVLHEFGHLLGGLATGYGFVSFRILDWILVRYPEGFRLKRYSIPGTLGQCLLSPPEKEDGDYPVLIYNYSGVVMNLVLIFISLAYLFWGSKPALTYFFYGGIFINLILAAMNIIPIEPNDGYNGRKLKRDQDYKDMFWEILYINSLLTRGEDVDLAYLEGIKSPIKTSLTAYIPLLMVSDFLAEEDYEKALSLLERVDKDYDLISLYSYEIYLETYFCETILDWKKGLDLKELELTKDLDRYMKMTKTYPSRHRFWIFYYGLVKADEKKLAQAQKNFTKSLKSYPTRGEAVKEEKIVKNLLKMIKDK